jgi:hypothetical protein
MKTEHIIAQSKAAYGQWKDQWRDHATIHSKYPMKSLQDFQNSGIGKAVLCVANGYSFEENIETIKKHQKNVDILCCDKTLGNLLDNGIIPTFCLVCDANVNYEKYMAKYKDQLKDTTLLINVCANPEWSEKGNWKDRYFFINKDVINSHLEFAKLSGCSNFIPAGTNVSNEMVIMLTQSDNDGRKNFFAYDKIILIGFDYSWKAKGKYYAFNTDGDGKSKYMTHNYITLPSGEFGYTSGNLAFSCQWLGTYISTFKLPIVQCGKDSLLHIGITSNLEEQMQYKYKPEDKVKVNVCVQELRKIMAQKLSIEKVLEQIGKDHWLQYMGTV